MIAEIVGPSGRVHYRRPVDDPLVEQAKQTPGYSVRVVEKETVEVPYEWDFDDIEDQDNWCERCHNTGELDCHCGGDLCVCTNYGTYPCPDCH